MFCLYAMISSDFREGFTEVQYSLIIQYQFLEFIICIVRMFQGSVA